MGKRLQDAYHMAARMLNRLLRRRPRLSSMVRWLPGLRPLSASCHVLDISVRDHLLIIDKDHTHEAVFAAGFQPFGRSRCLCPRRIRHTSSTRRLCHSQRPLCVRHHYNDSSRFALARRFTDKIRIARLWQLVRSTNANDAEQDYAFKHVCHALPARSYIRQFLVL